MTDSPQTRPAILCISTYEKGQSFLREAAHLGLEVIFLTVDKLREADWPWEAISWFETMPEGQTPEQVLRRIARIARERKIERVVPLDEFDLESAALIREHMRLPGMGQSPTRFFRDKLAMRQAAHAGGVPVPEFTGVFNAGEIHSFFRETEGPWLLKPRTNASAIGIVRIDGEDQLWRTLDELGDEQTNYLLERFIPGDIFHVEGITAAGEVLFAAPFRYGQPPIETMHSGGVFSTRSLDPASAEARSLTAMHTEVLRALGLRDGVSHTEFIRSHADGSFLFLETAARVGGAYIAEVVEFARGLNPWVEWARIEAAAIRGERYRLPELHPGFAGSVICLAKQQQPDLAAYRDPEVVWRLRKPHHAGLIVRSESAERVEQLVSAYAQRFSGDFCAVLPAPAKPTS